MGNDLMRQLSPYFAREIIPVTYLPDESGRNGSWDVFDR